MTAAGWDATHARAARILGRPLGKTESLLSIYRELCDVAEGAGPAVAVAPAVFAAEEEFGVRYADGTIDGGYRTSAAAVADAETAVAAGEDAQVVEHVWRAL